MLIAFGSFPRLILYSLSNLVGDNGSEWSVISFFSSSNFLLFLLVSIGTYFATLKFRDLGNVIF